MLVLTVTRQCNLRCAYCHTSKTGWPSLTPQDCTRAVALFVSRYGGGDVKLFGGEPLLEPEATRAAIAAAQQEPAIRRIHLSTNGTLLDRAWLDRVAHNPKLVLTVSVGGCEEDHDRFRRATDGGSYHRVTALGPALARTPRVVITLTIPPATAHRAADNLAHLYGLGFRRFNLLPAYFLTWTAAELDDLRRSFRQIGATIEAHWERGERFTLRNLYTWAPAPFFNSGIVVDADRRIHPSNSVLWSGLEEHLEPVGDLDHPPSPAALSGAAEKLMVRLQKIVAPEVWASTLAVDAALTGLCQRLYPALIQRKRRGQGAA